MNAEARVLAVTWIDLSYAMLCLDCEVSFDVRAFLSCPKCGRDSGVLLAKFLQERPEPSAPALSVDCTQRVLLGDVLDRVGNALTPARIRAQRIEASADLRGRIGPAFPLAIERSIQTDARRIQMAIDDAMARLRALTGPTTPDKESADGRPDDR